MNGKPTILIMDDESPIRTLVRKMLERQDYEVLEAASGEDALLLLEEHGSEIDVALLDVMMPGLDGFAILDIVKSNPKTADIKAIMLTAVAQVEDKVKAFSAGASDYLLKPFQRDELIVRIETQIKLKRAEEEVKQKNHALMAMQKELRQFNQHLEQRVAERTSEVERLLKQKDGFITQLGHDLGTPLTPLVALLPMLSERETDPKSKELFDVMLRNVAYMKELLARTLQLAKLSSMSMELSIEDVDLLGIFEVALAKQRYLFAENNINIENRIGGGIVVAADKLRLMEVLDNLISNAVKYIPSGDGNITFDARQNGEFITVMVSDTGVGMTSEQMEHMFEEFYKADESRHDHNSAGLGLTICKRIIEKHGGAIWAQSDGLGKGTTVSFTLRLSEAINGFIPAPECELAEA